MGVRVRKVVSKVEVDGGRVIKTEIYPDSDWVLVDGARDMTIVEQFRAQHGLSDYAITDFKPDDAVRVRVRRTGDTIEISLDRERGGPWWESSDNPTLKINFDSALVAEMERKIRISVEGGDLKQTVKVGEIPLLPPAKPSA